MPERQLALTGRPEIILQGGYKAVGMNEDDCDDWEDIFHYETILQRTITLEGLIERWTGKKIAGYALDLEGIAQLVRQTDQLPAYILIRQIEFSGGNRACRAIQISYPELKKEVEEGPSPSAVLFNLDDIEKFERDNFPPDRMSFNQLYGTITENTNTKTDKKQGKDNLQPETDCNPRSRKTLFKFILGLVDLYHINLAEPGLATSLENATEAKGRKLPRSTADQLLREIKKFEDDFAN